MASNTKSKSTSALDTSRNNLLDTLVNNLLVKTDLPKKSFDKLKKSDKDYMLNGLYNSYLSLGEVTRNSYKNLQLVADLQSKKIPAKDLFDLGVTITSTSSFKDQSNMILNDDSLDFDEGKFREQISLASDLFIKSISLPHSIPALNNLADLCLKSFSNNYEPPVDLYAQDLNSYVDFNDFYLDTAFSILEKTNDKILNKKLALDYITMAENYERFIHINNFDVFLNLDKYLNNALFSLKVTQDDYLMFGFFKNLVRVRNYSYVPDALASSWSNSRIYHEEGSYNYVLDKDCLKLYVREIKSKRENFASKVFTYLSNDSKEKALAIFADETNYSIDDSLRIDLYKNANNMTGLFDFASEKLFTAGPNSDVARSIKTALNQSGENKLANFIGDLYK